jgi:CubicO group peptidase (beta-lactamase class C family)
MTHTSGLPPYVGAAEQQRIQQRAGFPCPAATREYIRSLAPAGQPGQTVTYSCLNAILCAEIIEAVSGIPLDQFARRHLFEPLGMASTGFQPAESLCQRCLLTTRAAHGQGPDGFLHGQVHDPLAAMQGGVSGNAGLFSTAADLSRFAQMMLNGGTFGDTRILQTDTIRNMTRVQFPDAVNKQGSLDRRGLLWDLYVPDAEETGAAAQFAYGHTGYTGTAIRIYPHAGVYVIALTNRVHPNDQAQVGTLRQAVWNAVGPLLRAGQ